MLRLSLLAVILAAAPASAQSLPSISLGGSAVSEAPRTSAPSDVRSSSERALGTSRPEAPAAPTAAPVDGEAVASAATPDASTHPGEPVRLRPFDRSVPDEARPHAPGEPLRMRAEGSAAPMPGAVIRLDD